MARSKWALRRIFNTRFLTWSAARATVRAVPPLGRLFNFFPGGIAAMAAGRAIEDRRWQEPLPFSGELLHFVAVDCARYDKLSPLGDRRTDPPMAGLWRQAALIGGGEIQGHTGSIVLPAVGKTVNASGRPPNWNFAKPALLRDVGRIEGRAFFTYRTNHYYHFMMDNALRLVDALDRGIAGDGPLTVVRHVGGGAAQDAFYRAVQARRPALSVRALGPHERLRADEILWTMQSGANYEWSPFAPTSAAELASLFRGAYGIAGDVPRQRLIFLSRGAAKLRRLTNEPDLAALARARGFEVFVARGDNHVEQVRMFSQARAVIAVHGAGLTNLLFAAPGAAVLEIFPANFTKSTFAWMASRLGLRYQRLVGGEGNYDQAFAVDPAAFASALEALCAQT